MTTRERFLVATIFSLTVMVGVGTSTMPPALAAVQRTFGVGPDTAGILLSIFTLPGLILTPLLGYIADRIGRRAVLVISLLVFAAGGITALAATTFEHLVAARLIQGVGAASLGALNVALISDFFHGHQRIRLLGFNHSVLSVGTAILPVVSGQLAAVGWRLPFALPSVGLIVATAVLVLVPPVPAVSAMRPQSVISLHWRRLGILLAISAATYALLFGPFLNYVHERIRLLEPSNPSLYAHIGAIIGLMSVATTIGALFVGRLARRYTPEQLLQVACGLYAVALMLFIAVPTYWLLVIPTLVFGLAQAFNQPVVQSLVAAVAPPERLGTILSLNRSAALVGQTAGPLLFGIVYRAGDLAAVFVVGGGIAAVCMLAARWLRHNTDTRVQQYTS
ncbi:MAG: MFS transporter [Chlorobi bacterium]|nr:MFS transporter [Chlorobiota bacterium]